jgi:guanylate kinase
MIESGKCIILSAPSGSGKTTLVKHLLSFKNLNLVFSISATTREKRIDESHGKDYFFIKNKEFKKMIVDDEFIEFEEVYKGVFYGSLKKSVNDLLNKHNVIFDIDVEGGIKLKKFFKSDAMSVFVKPPNREALKNRLESRGLDSEKSITKRLLKSEKEMSREKMFDKVLVNNDLTLAKKQVLALVKEYLDFD